MAKFKVGDRVRWIGFDSWQNCEIKSVDHQGAYVDAEEGEGYLFFNAIDFVESSQPTIPIDIAERAIALVRDVAVLGLGSLPDTARAILADLEPVSVDLLAAREVAANEDPYETHKTYYQSGEWDGKLSVKVALAAIAKGRQLEREGK